MPELVPIRHGRMIVSPFTFYRGGAAIMAWTSRGRHDGLRVQCCGDAHLSNFGVFAAPDRRIVFVDDFDETLPAPFSGRQAAGPSFIVTARDNGHKAKEQRAAARAAAAAYRTTMRPRGDDAFPGHLVRRIEGEELFAEVAASTDKATVKAAQKTSPRRAGGRPRLARQVRREGRRRLPDQAAAAGDRAPPELMRAALSSSSAMALPDYAQSLTPDRRLVLDHYHYVDFARKVVGVGSVGTEAFMVLLMGDRDDDPLFLQVRRPTRWCSRPCGCQRVRASGRTGRRASGSRRPPATRSWAGSRQGDQHRKFYVRQLRDMKGSAVIELMPPARRPATASSAAARSRAPTPAPVTPRRSPATSVTTTHSTAHSNCSPWPTPTRTADTRRSARPRTSSARRPDRHLGRAAEGRAGDCSRRRGGVGSPDERRPDAARDPATQVAPRARHR